MTWICTWEGCEEQAAARVGTPFFPYPAGRGLGFVTVYPPDSRAAVGLPLCLSHTHHQVDVILMGARPEQSTGGLADA